MAEPKPARRRKRAQATAALEALATRAEPGGEIRRLAEAVEGDGGAVLASYREPFGGNWVLFAALPVGRVEPTPYQRDVSETHVRRLSDVIGKVGRFLDPIIVVRRPEGRYWTPNGNHRLQALKGAGGKAITALVLPEEAVAFQILALNTEKAHNLREKSLEVIRMARALAPASDRKESGFSLEFEEAPYLTLGACYEKNGRFPGGAYHPVLKRIDAFLDDALAKALAERERRAAAIAALEGKVAAAVAALKARGFASPYLRAFVVARINPLRFQRGATADFDATIERMARAAERFDAAKIRETDLARTGGPPEPAAD